MALATEVRSNEHNTTSYFQKAFDRAISTLDGYKPEDVIPAPFTILVRVVPPATETKGGLHLPEIAQKEKGLAVVMALPENNNSVHDYKIPCPWAVGDIVLYSRNAGEVLSAETDSEGEYILLGWNPEDCTSDVLGKIERGGAERLQKWLDKPDDDS